MKTILYFILVFTGLTFFSYFQSFGQNLSGNSNETITGQWTFTNPNGAAITVDHSNKPSNGASGGIRVYLQCGNGILIFMFLILIIIIGLFI